MKMYKKILLLIVFVFLVSVSFAQAMPSPDDLPPTPSAAAGSTASGSADFDNPLDFVTVEDFLENLLFYLQGIIAVIALIFIVIGAIMYISSTGDSGKVEKAKSTITYAMIGLAIAIAAPSFLREISTILGWTEGEAAAGGALSLTEIAMNVLNFLLSMVGILSVIMLVVGGITYVTSVGDENKIDSGKKMVKYSIIGIIVALSAMVIVKQIASLIA